MKCLITGKEYIKNFPDFELIGRTEELQNLISILIRQKSNSVILTGPAGAGCSALLIGLQKTKECPDVPFDIVAKRLFWLEVDELFKSGKSEVINKQFDTIVNTLKRTPDSILIIESTRDFLEATRGRFDNFINTLVSLVKTNETQIIFEVRDEDLPTLLGVHSHMHELFTLLDLPEPDKEDLPLILLNASKSLEKHHGIKISDDAIKTTIELTNKYRTKDLGLSLAQPERSTTLMDRSLSSYRLDIHKKHPDVIELEKQLSVETNPHIINSLHEKIRHLNEVFKVVQDELKVSIQNQRDAEIAIFELEFAIDELKEEDARKTKEMEKDVDISGIRNFAESGMFENDKIVEIRKKIKILQEDTNKNKEKFASITKSINEKLILNSPLVEKEFSRLSGISVDKLNQDDSVKLKNLEGDILKKIFGQDHAVTKLVNDIKVAKIGRRNGNKPLTSFLFLGPSGVGKTEITKVLSSALLDDESALTRFDMSEYMEKHSVSKLIGAPPGYEGYESGGILTNAMRKNPNRILLFDEIEKAHPDIFNLFLQILSDGRLTDNVGRTVFFSDSIIIMTTNIGQDHLLDDSLTTQQKEELSYGELLKVYRPEFLNRFNGRQNIVCFNSLGIDSIIKIVKREINSIIEAYKSYNLVLTISEEDIKTFCEMNYNPVIGARGLPGFIQSKLESKIANCILEKTGKDIKHINISYNKEINSFDLNEQ